MPDEDQAIIDDVHKELGELGLDTGSTDDKSTESQDEELEENSSTDVEDESGEALEDEDANDSEEGESEDDSEEDELEEDSIVEDDSEEDESLEDDKAADSFRARQGRREGKRLDTIEQGLSKLTQMFEQILAGGKPITQKQTTQISQKVTDLAKKHNTTPEAIQDLLELAKETVLPPEVLQKLDTSQAVAQEQVEKAHFSKEWNPLESTLKKEFPNATPLQLAKAKKLMDQLSHTVGIGGVQRVVNGKRVDIPYDLDYIFTKNRKKFESVLYSPKKKTGESGNLGQIDQDNDSEESGITVPKQEDMTPKKADALLNALSDMEDAEEAGGLEIQRGGEKIRV